MTRSAEQRGGHAAGRPIGLGRFIWRVSMHHPRSFWRGYLFFGGFFMTPLVSGWLLGRGFRALEHGSTGRVYAIAAGLAVAESCRMASLYIGVLGWVRSMSHMATFLRANMLEAQLVSGGALAGTPAGSAREAIPHFRDDVDDVIQLIDGALDLSYGLVFLAIGSFILARMNAPATAALVLPLLAIGVGARLLDGRIKRYRALDRAAASAVTGLVGDLMAAATTVKVNAATDAVTARLATLTEVRRHTAVRDRVLDEGVQALGRGVSNVAFGLALLVSAKALSEGRFGAPQMAVMVGYLGWLSFVPRIAGRVMARRKQAGVAIERMSWLVARNESANLVLDQDLPIEAHQDRPRRRPRRPERVSLERLDVIDLSARFPGGSGVGPVSLSLPRASFTVVTGPIGSGKTTLLRALLGIATNTSMSGEVRWNGRTLDDRAAFLVPPNAAFLPQVPQLISDTLADNIALGSVTDEVLAHALHLAELEHDIAAMGAGTSTLIGPRGLRLSGGQRQRVATARALVHLPELVVLDDLSSALDVETEVRLWDNLADAGMTVLAVSHRAVAFERADQVLHLEGGVLR